MADEPTGIEEPLGEDVPGIEIVINGSKMLTNAEIEADNAEEQRRKEEDPVGRYATTFPPGNNYAEWDKYNADHGIA